MKFTMAAILGARGGIVPHLPFWRKRRYDGAFGDEANADALKGCRAWSVAHS